MPTGLKFKGDAIQVGGLSLQPVKPKKQQSVDVFTSRKQDNTFDVNDFVAQVDVKLPKSDMKTPGNVGDSLKLDSTTAIRARILKERGISLFRPELIAGTRVLPSYPQGTSSMLTDLGVLLDTQIAARNLRLENINSFVQQLSQDEQIKTLLDSLREEYDAQLGEAGSDVKLIFDSFVAIDNVLSKFDIYRMQNSLWTLNARALPVDARVYTLNEIFVDHMGFSETGFRKFTNSKIFTQLVYDIGTVARKYTVGLFDITDDDRIDDQDPITIDRTFTTTNGTFTFNAKAFGDERQVVNAFKQGIFNRFLESLPQERSDKQKLLAVTMSRVLGISSALGSVSLRSDLLTLGVAQDSQDPILDMVGTPGQTILDEQNNNRSVSSMIHIDDENQLNLPFEKRYIVDKQGRKYTPGSDYFFDGLVSNRNKFDVDRILNYASRIKGNTTRAMNVIETATRTDTPYAQNINGSDNRELQGEYLYNDALRSVAEILNFANTNDDDRRAFLFITAIFSLAKNDRILKNLLFQLTALSVLYAQSIDQGAEQIEVMDNIANNEVKVFGDFPALKGFTPSVLTFEGDRYAKREVSKMPLDSAEDILHSYRQLQRLVIDRVFLILSRRSNVGQARIIAQQSAAAGLAFLRQINTRLVNDALSAVGVGGKTIDFDKPEASDSLDIAFKNVLFSIARFVDRAEDVASGGSRGSIAQTGHLRQDRSGRSRYLHLSSSMRFLFGFEFVSSMLGDFNFASYAGVDLAQDTVKIVYSDVKMKSFIRTAIEPYTTVIQAIINANQRAGAGPRGNAVLQNPLASTYLNARAGNADPRTQENYKSEFDTVRSDLKRDLDVLRSMTMTVRNIALQIFDATTVAKNHFDAANQSFDRIYEGFTISETERRRAPSQRDNRLPRKPSSDGRQKPSLPAKVNADDNEKLARRALLSRQQAMLALVRLNEVTARLNNLRNDDLNQVLRFTRGFGGRRERQYTDIFSDDSRIENGVQHALWSMLSEPEFRGNRGISSRILTVGIPAGLNDKLEDSDLLEIGNEQDYRSDRQFDMVTVDVSMRDLLEEDIVFSQKKFVFEMSRFVTANSFDALPQSDAQSQQRKFGRILDEDVRMLDLSTFNLQDIYGQSSAELLVDGRYTFMPEQKRRELVRNHTISYLTSVYIRMLTGMNVNEDAFPVESEAVKAQDDPVTSAIIRKIAERIVTKSELTITLAELRARFPEFDHLLTSIEEGEFQPGLLEEQLIYDRVDLELGNSIVTSELTDLAKLGSSDSLLSGGERQRRKITSPRIFERIFNVVVDPFEIEIDVDMTRSTKTGREALTRLVKEGRIVERGGLSYFKRVDPDADVTMFQFFTNVSRYEPPEIDHNDVQRQRPPARQVGGNARGAGRFALR